MLIAATVQNLTPAYDWLCARRVTRRLDSAGYWMLPDHCRVSPASIQRFLAKTYTLLEQRADGCRLSEYWKHYKTWAHTQYLTPSGVMCINARLYEGLVSVRKWFHVVLDENLATTIL